MNISSLSFAFFNTKKNYMELLKKSDWLKFKKEALSFLEECKKEIAVNKQLKESIARLKAKNSTIITLNFSTLN